MNSQLSSRVRAIASAFSASNIGTPRKLGNTTTLDLATAENWLIREELAVLYRQLVQNHLDPSTLSYPNGLGGDPGLLEATATFFNTYFNPAHLVCPNDVVITTGASLCLDALMFSICEAGDGVLVTAPYWNGFDLHLVLRSGIKLLPVHEPSADIGITPPEDLLKGSLVPALTLAYESSPEPSRVKALVITNPHNPYGRSYPEGVIVEAMRWCAERGIHYVSDEVYALSELMAPDGYLQQDPAFSREQHDHEKSCGKPWEYSFVSALSVRFGSDDKHDVNNAGLGSTLESNGGCKNTPRIDNAPEISVIWSTSKDLCSSGLRVGVYVHRRQPPSFALPRPPDTPESSATAASSPSRPVAGTAEVSEGSTSVTITPPARSLLTTALSILTTPHLPTLTTSLLTKQLFTSPSLPHLLWLNRTRLRGNYVLLRSHLREWGVPHVEVQSAPFVFARLGCAAARVRRAEAEGRAKRLDEEGSRMDARIRKASGADMAENEAREIGCRKLSAEEGGGESMDCLCTWEDERFLVQTLLRERAGVLVAPGRQFHVEKENHSGVSSDNDVGGERDSEGRRINKAAGWVRITFAVPRPVLEEAIGRFGVVLGLKGQAAP
ncbi:pyridoxal phosphate-dependent transferase [Xylaria acuta]|nr:pyridoxal phosphate-dependent transferase [Xylaria acuta]